jgi:predicted RNase H-like nuclease (RuvC/YqgF family)
MSEIASARINSLPSHLAQAHAPPSEEAVFILTASQLKDIITQALQPLQDRVSSLEEKIDRLEEENAALRLKLASIETTEEHDVTRIYTDIAYDRQRLARLETRGAAPAPTAPPQGEKTSDRITKLKDYLKSRGSGATFHEVERLLDIKPNQMTKLVSQLDKRSFEVFTRSGDGRQRVLRLKAQIISRER